MNRREDYAGTLFATDSEEGVRSLSIRTTDEGFVAGKGTSKGAAVFMNSSGWEPVGLRGIVASRWGSEAKIA